MSTANAGLRRADSTSSQTAPLRRTSTIESACSGLMELANIHHDHSFSEVIEYLKRHMFECVLEVHKMKRLSLDDGVTYVNCPPPPTRGDSHGGEIIRTLSEDKETDGSHIQSRKEFCVMDVGPAEGNTEENDLRKFEVKSFVIKKCGTQEDHKETFELTRPAWF